MASPVFLITWLLADQDDGSVSGPFSEDRLGSPFVQIASGAGGCRFF
jgi:hypothetical protein